MLFALSVPKGCFAVTKKLGTNLFKYQSCYLPIIAPRNNNFLKYQLPGNEGFMDKIANTANHCYQTFIDMNLNKNHDFISAKQNEIAGMMQGISCSLDLIKCQISDQRTLVKSTFEGLRPSSVNI